MMIHCWDGSALAELSACTGGARMFSLNYVQAADGTWGYTGSLVSDRASLKPGDTVLRLTYPGMLSTNVAGVVIRATPAVVDIALSDGAQLTIRGEAVVSGSRVYLPADAVSVRPSPWHAAIESALEAFGSGLATVNGQPLTGGGDIQTGGSSSGCAGGCVAEFDGRVSGGAVKTQSVNMGSGDDGCEVVYNEDSRRFVIAVSSSSQARIVGGMTDYYNNWADGDLWGEPTPEGRCPVRGRIYVDCQSDLTYRWDGESLVQLG